MKNRSTLTGKFLLDGAIRIVSVPSMNKTKRSIEAGSLSADWRAVGNDLRRSLVQKEERLVG